jgi:hypothetical protein
VAKPRYVHIEKIISQWHPCEARFEVSKFDMHIRQKIALRPVARAASTQCLHKHFILKHIKGTEQFLSGCPTPRTMQECTPHRFPDTEPTKAEGQMPAAKCVFTLVKMSPRGTFTVTETYHVVANTVHQDPQATKIRDDFDAVR